MLLFPNLALVGLPRHLTKEHKKDHAHLLLGRCLSLLGLFCVFIGGSYAADIPPLCGLLSALLHYFFLTSLFIMASTAVDLYLKLVVVLGGIRNIIIMANIVSWGMSLAHVLLITIVSVAISLSVTVTLGPSYFFPFCSTATPVFIVAFCFAPDYNLYIDEN